MNPEIRNQGWRLSDSRLCQAAHPGMTGSRDFYTVKISLDVSPRPGLLDLYDVKISPDEAAMTIFLILAPYGAFATLMLVTSATVSLFAAPRSALPSIALRHRFTAARSRCSAPAPRSCSLRSVCYLALIDSGLEQFGGEARRSIAACSRSRWRRWRSRFPFTLQYAREAVDAETAHCPASCGPTTSSPRRGPAPSC